MYHISNLGSFAGNRCNPDDPAYYEDAAGFVPQEGDPVGDLTGAVDAVDDWADWVRRAVSATARAERRAAAWRERRGSGDPRTEKEWARDVADASARQLATARPVLTPLMLQFQLLAQRADVHGLSSASHMLRHYEREIGLLLTQAGNVIDAVRVAEES